jgi:Ion channel
MRISSTLLGIVLIVGILWEGFETVIFPRRVTRRLRLTRLFYRSTWLLWSGLVARIFSANRREVYLGIYGPISLLLLLIVWAAGMVTGFALLHWASATPLHTPEGDAGFSAALYFSGSTFFTLGLGDVRAFTAWGRALTVLEAGVGFGFLALVIAYLPALNQSFSRREVSISLLDARAGSPPTAYEMLRRHSHDHALGALQHLLKEWEQWSAEFLEIHLSYPVLAYFRSQHDNQSWLGALTAILDACALVIMGIEGACERQARLTFAMARHAVVDLALIFGTPPGREEQERLPSPMLQALRQSLAEAGLKIREGAAVDQSLAELRAMYEPYVYALASYFHITLPPWMEEGHADNWQTSRWEEVAAITSVRRRAEARDRHF